MILVLIDFIKRATQYKLNKTFLSKCHFENKVSRLYQNIKNYLLEIYMDYPKASASYEYYKIKSILMRLFKSFLPHSIF